MNIREQLKKRQVEMCVSAYKEGKKDFERGNFNEERFRDEIKELIYSKMRKAGF